MDQRCPSIRYMSRLRLSIRGKSVKRTVQAATCCTILHVLPLSPDPRRPPHSSKSESALLTAALPFHVLAMQCHRTSLSDAYPRATILSWTPLRPKAGSRLNTSGGRVLHFDQIYQY